MFQLLLSQLDRARVSCLCLFVNKVDLLVGSDAQARAKAVFAGLHTKLERFSKEVNRLKALTPELPPTRAVVLAGSLEIGLGVPELEQILRAAGISKKLDSLATS